MPTLKYNATNDTGDDTRAINFNLYSFKYSCPRWYGYEKGVHNIYIKDDLDEDVEKLAIKEANYISGSKSCNIQLLNKFRISINSIETYPSLTGINFIKK